MASGPLQISDLGIDASRQYALNQKELSHQLLQDAQAVQGKMEISVISPARPLDLKFEVGYKTIWAVFNQPADFAVLTSNLFTHLLVPSLGGADTLSEKLDLVAAAAKPEPALQKLLKQLLDDEETYRLIQGRMRQFAKG